MTLPFYYNMALVLILILAVADSSTPTKDIVGEMSLHEKAVHHFDQLVRVLTKIKKSGSGDLSTIMTAAAAAGSGSGHHDNNNIESDDASTLLILRSLLGSCSTFQNVGEGSETNINIFNNATIHLSSRADKKKKSSDKSRATKEKGRGDGSSSTSGSSSSTDGQPPSTPEFRQVAKSPEELTTWVENLVRPMNFTLKREPGGQMVRVTFDVLRTEPGVASHSWTYDGERKTVKGPSGYGLDVGLPISSPVDFVINASRCPPRSFSRPRREHFSFFKKSNSLDSVTFIMPTCFLDVMNGMRENGRSREEIEWNEPEDEYAQKLYYPSHFSKMDISSIQVVPGKNVTFDIQVAMGKEDHVIIEGMFYNATSDSTFIANNLFLQQYDDQIQVQSSTAGDPEREELLFVEVLNSTRVNGSIPGFEYKTLNTDTTSDLFHISATLRITVMIENEDMSGTIYFQNEFNLPLKGQETSILSLLVTKSVQLVKADQTGAFPKGKYLMHTKTKFQCGDRGFSHYQGFGDNCTFFCSIFGTDLKSVRVRKVSGGITAVVQKYAEVNSNNAILFVNLGPTRKEIDGEYECRAIEIGGKRHKWTVTVGTWGFPKIKQTTLDAGNDSSTFVCVFASERPVDIYTTLRSGGEASRIDDHPNVTRVLQQNGNETRMEVTLPTRLLRWPNEFLTCEVTNVAGSDGSTEMLGTYDVPDYYRGTDHPFLWRDESLVTDHRDGPTTVKCAATGKDPLQIDFYVDHLDNDESIIKNNSMTIITTEREGDKTITSLSVATSSLSWPHHTISCRAQNEYGKDMIDFELASVIHKYF